MEPVQLHGPIRVLAGPGRVDGLVQLTLSFEGDQIPAMIGAQVTATVVGMTCETTVTLPIAPPHSRACDWRAHDHGPACHPSCPTCGGEGIRAVPFKGP